MPSEAEKNVAQRLKDYGAAAAKSEGVDRAALAIAALEAAQFENHVTPKMKKWAYIISLGLPPLGLVFAGWYYFSDKTDGKRVATICAALTLVGGLILWFSVASLTSSLTPQTVDQFKNIKPEDINSLLR